MKNSQIRNTINKMIELYLQGNKDEVVNSLMASTLKNRDYRRVILVYLKMYKYSTNAHLNGFFNYLLASSLDIWHQDILNNPDKFKKVTNEIIQFNYLDNEFIKVASIRPA